VSADEKLEQWREALSTYLSEKEVGE